MEEYEIADWAVQAMATDMSEHIGSMELDEIKMRISAINQVVEYATFNRQWKLKKDAEKEAQQS